MIVIIKSFIINVTILFFLSLVTGCDKKMVYPIHYHGQHVAAVSSSSGCSVCPYGEKYSLKKTYLKPDEPFSATDMAKAIEYRNYMVCKQHGPYVIPPFLLPKGFMDKQSIISQDVNDPQNIQKMKTLTQQTRQRALSAKQSPSITEKEDETEIVHMVPAYDTLTSTTVVKQYPTAIDNKTLLGPDEKSIEDENLLSGRQKGEYIELEDDENEQTSIEKEQQKEPKNTTPKSSTPSK